jgi:ElaB/YqjD/DUF883 family membrane-anchored ribosome-binding protein
MLYFSKKGAEIMEPRTKDLTEDVKNAGRQAKESAAEMGEDLASRARQAKAAAMEGARAAYQVAQTKAREGAKRTDEAIRGNPYASLGIAFGAGLLFGFLLKRK